MHPIVIHVHGLSAACVRPALMCLPFCCDFRDSLSPTVSEIFFPDYKFQNVVSTGAGEKLRFLTRNKFIVEIFDFRLCHCVTNVYYASWFNTLNTLLACRVGSV